MPELPEVRVTTTNLNRVVKNKTIAKFSVGLSKKLFKEFTVKEFEKFLLEETILRVDNRAKFIIFYLTNNKILLSHLRMEGKYKFHEKEVPLEKNEHMSLVFSDGTDLHYNDTRHFGTFHMRTIKNYLTINPLAKLAPIPANIDFEAFYTKMKKTTRAVKSQLLEQDIVAGFGNIYVNETLFLTRVNPTTSANKISRKKYQEILKVGQKIMDESTKCGGTTIKSYVSLNNNEGHFQKFLQIHGKNKQNCSVCKTIIKKMKVNGRGTDYCPKCQK